MIEVTTQYDAVGNSLFTPQGSYAPLGNTVDTQSTGIQNPAQNPIQPQALQGGVYNGILIIGGGQVQSGNYVSGSAGWIINSDGSVEFNNGTFRGTLTAGSIAIPNSTTTTSFQTDTNGNSWWGATTFAAAPASISNAGAATFTSVTITGDVNLPLVNGVQGTEATGYRNNTGAQGTLTVKVGKMTMALSGTAAAGEVGIDTDVAFIDMTKAITFVIDFKFDQFTFSGSASDSTMFYAFLVGAKSGGTRQDCFGMKATATGSGSQTLVFSAVNYNTAGTETRTTISPTVNVTNKLLVVYTPSTSIKFYLGGTLVATHTTNLPASNSTSELLYIDGQVQSSNVSSPPTLTISRFAVVGTCLS